MTAPVTPDCTLRKDPIAEKLYGFDWTDWLSTDAEIAASTWTIALVDGDDALTPVTSSSETIDADGKTTSALLEAGVLNQTYKVTNRITTNETPPQIDERSFYLRIVDR
jgi:hypothetical protein